MLKLEKYGRAGIIVGIFALLLSVVDFWAGPFSPQPTMETTIAEKAASLRQAAIDALKGKEVEKTYVKTTWNMDKIISVAIPVVGVVAILLGALSFIFHESTRAAGSAVAMGVSAIAFQFFAMYAMALLVVFLIYAVLSSVGLDDTI